MKTEIKNLSLKEKIQAIPSKSYEQRVLLGALFARKTEIQNFGQSKDILAARNILSELGCKFTFFENKLIINSEIKTFPKIINCKESGFLARSIVSIISLFQNNFIITGENSLLQRKIANDFDFFQQMNWDWSHNNNCLPIIFKNAVLKNGKYKIQNPKTSQLISGLLFALPLLSQDSELLIKNVVSVQYIYLTIEILKKVGIIIDDVNNEKNFNIFIKGNQKYNSESFKIEGDWSGTSILMVAAALSKDICISGLNKNSYQADKAILDIFDLANIKYFWENKNLKIFQSEIKSFQFDAENCPDLIPALCVLALFAEGQSKIYGANRLFNKESSRGEIIVKEFLKIGAKIFLDNNKICIIGNQKYKSATLSSHNDHRIAMAEIILALKIKNGITIDDTECLNKSFPDFLKNFESLRKTVKC
ncbi:MAG: hypothetical protein LBV69_08020 [Bacteroidales bacterium]|nr:hypothetical protein [Bacteroidales bacterium]